MNYIIHLASEGYKFGAEKILTEALRQNKKCKIIEIQDVLDKKSLYKIKTGQVLLYFLTNDNSVPVCIEFFKDIGWRIINERLLSTNVSKFVLQQKMKKDGISVPESIPVLHNKNGKLYDIKYPIYIKSQKQASVVIYTKNVIELDKNKALLGNLNEYYLEKAVVDVDFVLKKFYYIKGSIIDMDLTNIDQIPVWFIVTLNNIAQSLELEVFSADIFVNWSIKKYSCIDVNPAPAFFKSDKAREEFVKNILL